jgi:hypothetical protein
MPDTDLTKRHCVPCEGGTDPLTQEQEEMYLSAVPNWEIKREGTHTVQRDIECKSRPSLKKRVITLIYDYTPTSS